MINSQDIFKVVFSDLLATHGITVHWVENWDLYHALSGGLGSGVNAARVIRTDYSWWEGPKPECINPPSMDTNDDCQIDLADFAEFASQWMTCGWDIQEACWQ